MSFKMRSLKYSFIVACYNVENYIDDCMLSLTSLSYDPDHFEIIAVNDGSQDGTQEKLYKWRQSFNNVIVIDQENRGLGGARNTGLRYARGEWIFYVDSDDWISIKNLLTIMDTLTNNSAVNAIKTTHFVTTENRNQLNIRYFNDKIDIRICNSEELLNKELFLPNVWLGCYRKSALLKMGYPFREKVAYEDTDWSTLVNATFGKISLVDLPYYSYYVRNNSLSNECKKKTFEDNIKSLEALLEILKLDISEYSKSITISRIKADVFSKIKFSRNFKLSDSIDVYKHIKQKKLLQSGMYECSIYEKIKLWTLRNFTLPILTIIRLDTLCKRMVKRTIANVIKVLHIKV